MSRFPTSSRPPDVVDVQDVRRPVPRHWLRSNGFWTLLVATLVAFAVASWWIYAIYVKPNQDQRRVDEAVMRLETTPSTAERTRRMDGWSKERRLLALAVLFRNEELGVPVALGLKASRAALDLAIYNGSHEARLELGKALRDGDFGEKDIKAAASQFQVALKDLQPGIKSGDQNALYVYSLMLKDGLGIDADPKKSREIMKRVALSRDNLTMHSIGLRAALEKGDEQDLELAKTISQRLIETGHPESYSLGRLACLIQSEPPPEETDDRLDELYNARDWEALRPMLAKSEARLTQAKRCNLGFVRSAADKGDRNAVAELATLMAKDSVPDQNRVVRSGKSNSADMQGQKRVSNLSVNPQEKNFAADAETQSRTGYLNGTKQIAKGGLSTFQVDNTKGGGDAVVRLYRDSKRPAARSMFVKNGESFTADAVAPGDYKLRYRYIGSNDTFEAGDTFTLSETRTPDGTRFSRVTVTLYKVANGNMTVKRVDSSEF